MLVRSDVVRDDKKAYTRLSELHIMFFFTTMQIQKKKVYLVLKAGVTL